MYNFGCELTIESLQNIIRSTPGFIWKYFEMTPLLLKWFYQLLVTKYNLIFFPIYEDRRCINGDYIFMYRCVFQIMCFLGTMKLESSKIYHITPGVQWKYIHMSLCDSRMTWFPDKYPYICFLLKTLFNTKNCQNNLVLTCRLWGIYI